LLSPTPSAKSDTVVPWNPRVAKSCVAMRTISSRRPLRPEVVDGELGAAG